MQLLMLKPLLVLLLALQLLDLVHQLQLSKDLLLLLPVAHKQLLLDHQLLQVLVEVDLLRRLPVVQEAALLLELRHEQLHGHPLLADLASP